MQNRFVNGVVALSCVLLLSATAWAQQASGIAGLVKDTSGAVLPGVTVEAASPALIEKVRTVVTDGQGRYNIVDLRTGSYVVTFTLPGFSTVRREGIVLPAGFTATVNADLQIGSVEETITVTGEAPLVDTQNTRQQKVISSDLLAALPTIKAVYAVAALTPGLVGPADVGGSRGVSSYVGDTYHGKTDGQTKTTFDGMRFQNMQGVGNSFYIINSAAVGEMVLETGGTTAESIAAGFGMNLIPKEGGNTFSFSATGMYTYDGLQSNNFDDALRARGLTSPQTVVKLFDGTAAVGGPIKKDKLWFFTSHRVWGNRNQVPGIYWNKTQGTPFYTPDLTRPWVRSQTMDSHAVRMTWQVSPKNKIAGFADPQQQRLLGAAAAFIAPEAVNSAWHFWPTGLYQVTWSLPKTNRLLLEAGGSATVNHWPGVRQPGVLPTHVSILEQSTGFVYNNRATLGVGNSGNHGQRHTGDRYAQRFAISYITGTHAFKTGFQLEQGLRDMETVIDGDVQYRFLNGVPVELLQFATPQIAKERIKADLGIYAQDQWTLKHLTLNYGVRFSYFNAYVPEQHLPPGRWVGARDFAKVPNVPTWTDLDPRLGVSYDLRGDGKTALKVSIGRYVNPAGLDLTGLVNPLVTAVNQVTRPWTDTDGDYTPDCDLANISANGECGPVANQNFGKNNPKATLYAEDVLHGFGHRGYSWDFASEVQHELRAGVSLTGGYYRNWLGNFRVTDNTSVTSANYSPYCVRGPVDARLPGGGGAEICGVADINPDKFGQVLGMVTQSSNYGTQRKVNDFFGLTVNTRSVSGIRLGGGVDTGRSVSDTCFVIDSPQELLYCRVVTPFGAQTQLKLNGSYPLPRDFVLSGVFQNVAGPVILANWPAPTAAIAPSLGRNLSGGRATAIVPLIKPQTQFEKRRTQLDLRVSKAVRFGRTRLQGNFDVFNVLNANSVLGVNNTYGPLWLRPTSILDGRLIEVSGQIDF